MNEAEDVSDLWQKPAKEMSRLVDHLSSAQKARNSRPEDVGDQGLPCRSFVGFFKNKHPPQEVLAQKCWVSSCVFFFECVFFSW